MPSEIHYCDKCGRLIPPSAIEDGSAVISSEAILCAECLKKLTPDERKALSAPRAAAPARVASGRRRPREGEGPGAAAPAGGSKVVAAVAVGIGAAVVSALLGMGLLGGGGSGPPGEPRPMPTVGPPTGPSPAPSPTGAAHQLARIRAIVDMGDSRYSEARGMLVQFPESFAGTPEVEDAGALLAEIDEAYAKRVEEALSAARTEAVAHASAGRFDDAESSIASIEERFGAGPWFESKGRVALTEARSEIAKLRREWEIKNAATTLEKARAEFDAGRLQQAGKLIADRAKWPADVRSRADELAGEIDRKITEIAAAKKLEEEREEILAEFDRMMLAGEYAAARDHADAKAETEAGRPISGMLRAAVDVARVMADEPAARISGARTLVGEEVRLQLARGTASVIVEGASEASLSVVKLFTINGRTTKRGATLKWDELHADQKAELAKLGGLRVDKSDARIASAYVAFASDDFKAALESVNATAGHPLAERLARVVRERRAQLAYEAAMARARKSAASEEWKGVVEACEEALTHKPGDREATDLLAEVFKYDRNLLINGSAELFPFTENGWTQASGSWRQLTSAEVIKPKHAKVLFAPGESSPAELFQDVSVEVYSGGIKSGAQQFKFEGAVAGWHESMRIIVECRASNGQVLDKFDTGEVGGRSWKIIERSLRPPAGTVKLRVRMVARRRKGRTNNSYYDDLRLIALRPLKE